MPSEVIPFANLQESGFEELGGASPAAFNVITDRRGCVRRRPGIVALEGIPANVDGNGISAIHTTLGGLLFVVGAPSPASPVYYINTAVPGPAVNLGDVSGGLRPTIAETEALLVFAAGGAMRRVDLTTVPALSDLGGTPPFASHVVAQNLRLLSNDLNERTKAVYSNQAIGTLDFSGNEEWPGTLGVDGGFFTAESRPDPITAITENTNEVFVWGSSTLQVFAPDPALVYAPVATREVGCPAPSSIVKVDEDFLLLDHRRRFTRTNGRSLELVGGQAVQRQLDEMETVSDCFGYRFQAGPYDAQVWSFPSDGRTYVYQAGVGWGQWSGWRSGFNANWTPLLVSAHHQPLGSASSYVGTSDGRIGQFSLDSAEDFGSPIRAYIETGFLDRGSSAQKSCDRVRVTLRRGEASGEPRGLLSYRNDLGEWEPPFEVELGRSGDYETTITLHSLGVYQTRQWRFEFDSEAPLVLVKVEEDFTVL